jgi:phospholipase D
LQFASAVAVAALAFTAPAHADTPLGPTDAKLSVCFTPAQKCEPPIVAAIASAKNQIRVQAYNFTQKDILSALAEARKRGVDVEIILDKTNDRTKSGKAAYTGATYEANAGVPVWIDEHVAIAHNKVIVIDGRLVIGGSFNYTDSAEKRNAENVTFTDSPTAAGWFLKNWDSRRAASRAYVAPAN